MPETDAWTPCAQNCQFRRRTSVFAGRGSTFRGSQTLRTNEKTIKPSGFPRPDGCPKLTCLSKLQVQGQLDVQRCARLPLQGHLDGQRCPKPPVQGQLDLQKSPVTVGSGPTSARCAEPLFLPVGMVLSRVRRQPPSAPKAIEFSAALPPNASKTA